MYKIFTLDKANADTFKILTYRYYHPFFSTDFTNIAAIGVEENGEPIALILAMILAYCGHPPKDPTKTIGQILSVFVVPSRRNQGLGKELLAKMEIELSSRGCSEIWFKYLDNPSKLALERILQQQNWSNPQATALICYANLERASQPHLNQYLKRLLSNVSDNYSIFPWNTLTDQERQSIESQIQTGLLARKFSPFVEEDKIEALNSVGLRHKERVVGWMITHRIEVDTIRYTQMFVYPDSQPLSRSILPLVKAISLQLEKVPEATKATFRVEIDNSPMVKFVNRRLAPYLNEVRTAYKTSKCIQTDLVQI